MESFTLNAEMAFNLDHRPWFQRRPFAFDVSVDFCTECLCWPNPLGSWINARCNQAQQPLGLGSGCLRSPHSVSAYRHEPLTAVHPIPEQIMDMPELASGSEPNERLVPQHAVGC
jgi:hypothetical protein